jgi:hypothetical protein
VRGTERPTSGSQQVPIKSLHNAEMTRFDHTLVLHFPRLPRVEKQGVVYARNPVTLPHLDMYKGAVGL